MITEPRILILVLGCNSEPFPELIKTQRETWNSIEEVGVSTLFYVGDSAEIRLVEDVLHVPTSDDYEHIHWKTKLAFDYAMGVDWDFLFRANASAYVCKRSLVEFVKTLPESMCYCGIAGQTAGGEWLHVNGGGMILSRDVVDILRNELKEDATPHNDDGEYGKICASRGIPITPGKRVNYFWQDMSTLPPGYHYKCRSKDGDSRASEMQAMRHIFQLKQSE